MGIPISQSKKAKTFTHFDSPYLVCPNERPSRKMAGRRAATHHERCLL